ncbi:MAG: zinc-dependent metalloprotease, partial [Bacteroidales bacterium]|nr:zinc-dependent metalloprotease [Bacteroidales bacterium]
MKTLKRLLLLAALWAIICPVSLEAKDLTSVKASVKKGKILLELPDSLLGRTWAMASTVRAISDSRLGTVGLKDVNGLNFYTFEKVDSTIRLKEVSFDFSSSDGNILKALSDSHIGATVEKFDIKSTSDEGRYVVDATGFFLSDKKELDPTEHNPLARETVKKSYKKDLSYIAGAKSFDDNFSVAVSRTYTYEVKKKETPLTVETVTSFLLLPEEIYHPRIADPRINFFFTRRAMVEDLNSTSKDVWFVNRWRLEPSDTAAYRRGVAVEPIKPITFWIDNNFPEWWKPYIFDAVLQWNEVFENIGFKNAIRALPFPEDDPEFDPENIRYNCIRYAPVSVQNAMGPSWTDPRSGEIINASVWVCHDVIKLLSVWMFVQTAQADPAVRSADIPKEVLGDALTYVLRHEVGHTLGLMHNMSASTCFSIEQLRDPEFTQENGTTASIMDYARFNYVAAPGDKERGVRLSPPKFGKNDYWAIRWGYTPVFDASSFEEETKITAGWITDSVAVSPIYRYGKQQMGMFFDPRCQTEDLSDDVFAASEAGVRNLKYIMSGFLDWISDESDPDMKYRTELYLGIVNQYLRYAGHLMHNIEGVYRNETVPGDGFKRFENVPRDVQERALDDVFKMYSDLDWLEDKAVLGRLPIVGSPVDNVRRSIAQNLMGKVFAAGMIDGIDTEELPVKDLMDMLFDRVWKPTLKGRALTDGDRLFQRVYVQSLMNMVGYKNPADSEKKDAFHEHDDHICDILNPHSPMGSIHYDEISGFEWDPRSFGGGHISRSTVYAELMRVRKLIGNKTGKGEDKGHYALLRSII